jgi:hypothetical protein
MTRAETLQRIAAALAHCEREHTQQEIEAAALALRLHDRWPPVQQELLHAA